MHSHKDLFSTNSQAYAQFRPHYPREIFSFLASLCRQHEKAWDSATGNGQAASMLVEYFDKVLATDLSKNQLSQALPHEKICYSVATAERSQIKDSTIDLITVAQAFHWFDHKAFAQEVRRVAKKDAILAVWCYDLPEISTEIDTLYRYFYFDIVGDYWEPERMFVATNYDSINMPFIPMKSETFSMRVEWNVEQLMGYLKTWSSVQKYTQQKKCDPVDFIREELTKIFGNEIRVINWQITPRIWRI